MFYFSFFANILKSSAAAIRANEERKLYHLQKKKFNDLNAKNRFLNGYETESHEVQQRISKDEGVEQPKRSQKILLNNLQTAYQEKSRKRMKSLWNGWIFKKLRRDSTKLDSFTLFLESLIFYIGLICQQGKFQLFRSIFFFLVFVSDE